ncbi:MAG: hypothetical protein B7X04_03875 [Parcubacteria group bacterium 21-54-25]|nr:MAG: hypothetical protein B7X04_03875 [Parcubacteria group bacterium 21-54-25]HQU08184.1 hypothetical protein [Candidatus Paceibacterota bacterium]
METYKKPAAVAWVVTNTVAVGAVVTVLQHLALPHTILALMLATVVAGIVFVSAQVIVRPAIFQVANSFLCAADQQRSLLIPKESLRGYRAPATFSLPVTWFFALVAVIAVAWGSDNSGIVWPIATTALAVLVWADLRLLQSLNVSVTRRPGRRCRT